MDRASQYTLQYQTAARGLSGWRKIAFYLTLLTVIITSLLFILLIVSLHVIDGGETSISEETIFYTGSCHRTSIANLVIHLAINIIGTCIIGSSNFFMQILVAPRRRDIDHAHTYGYWMEIGVNSIRNFQFISKIRTSLWALIALSSIPLHLSFNGCILESKATSSLLALMVSDSFIKGADFSLPARVDTTGIGTRSYNETIHSIQQSLAPSKTGKWENITFKDCMDRYNDLGQAMVDHRHVLMVVSNLNNISESEWNETIRKYPNPLDPIEPFNSLWFVAPIARTGNSTSPITEKGSNKVPGTKMRLNPATGVMTMDGGEDKPAFEKMKVDYCLSERFTTSCRLSIANPLLLIVCVLCAVKSLVFAVTLGLLHPLRNLALGDPLMTIGDAIASFISRPDTETKGMCTFSAKDLAIKVDIHGVFANPRSWFNAKRQLAGTAIPAALWISSYLFIGIFFLLSGCLLKPALEVRSL